MSCTSCHIASFEPCCIHAFHVLVWGVKLSIRVERSSHYKWCNLSQLLVTKAFDLYMIRSWSHLCVACILTLKCNLGPLGYHAPWCIIDGPRTKGHASLSPMHDRKHWPCLHMLKIPYHALSVGCCCQNCLLQEFYADRQYRVPTGTIWVADNPIRCRWKF